jgi:signal transduction histidine kinase
MTPIAHGGTTSIGDVALHHIAQDLAYLGQPHAATDAPPPHVAYDLARKNPFVAAVTSVYLPPSLRAPVNLTLGVAHDAVRRDLVQKLMLLHHTLGGTAELETRIQALSTQASDTLATHAHDIVSQLQRNVLVRTLQGFSAMHQQARAGLWSRSDATDASFAQDFSNAEHDLTEALAQFDAGDSAAAFQTYARVMETQRDLIQKFSRAADHDYYLKFSTGIGILFSAGLAAGATGGATLYAATGSAAVTGTTGIGAFTASLLVGGATFAATETFLNHRILQIPTGDAATMVEKSLKAAAMIGYLRAFGQVIQMPTYTGTAASAINFGGRFGVEYTGMTSFSFITEGSHALAPESMLHGLATLAGLKVGHGALYVSGKGISAAHQLFAERFPHADMLARRALMGLALFMLGVPNDGATLATRVGTPPASDLPMLLEHISSMIQRRMFADCKPTHHALTMVFDILSHDKNPENILRLVAIAQARDAAVTFGDTHFLQLAQQAAQDIPQPSRSTVLADLDKTAESLRPLQLPEHLMAQLRETIRNGQEVQTEDIINRLADHIMDTCHTLVRNWGDAEKAVDWAHNQIQNVINEIRTAATSLSRRHNVHDTIGLLALLRSHLSLTLLYDTPNELSAGTSAYQFTASKDLTSMVATLEGLHRLSVKLTSAGLHHEQLASHIEGRDLFVALRNLVGNARQHPRATQTQVDVHVALVKTPGGNMITVADNGAGMPPETAINLLSGRPMHDGHVVDHRNPQEFHGFGWLRIREACAKLGIVPEINSEPGQGTTVTLHLPRGLLQSDTPRTAAEDTALLHHFLRAAIIDRVLLHKMTASQIGPWDPMLDQLTTERRTPDVLRAVARFRLQAMLPGITLPADLSAAATAGALYAHSTPLFWKTVLTLVTTHPSRDMRRLAIEMVHHNITRTTPEERTHLARVVQTALRDSDATIVLQAWQLNRATRVIDPQQVTEDWLNWQEPGASPAFGLARYVFGSASDHAMRRSTLNPIMETSALRDARIDIRTVQPMHSLADYNPNDAQRKLVLGKKMERLDYLLRTFGSSQRDNILMLFTFEDGNGNIEVLELPSGHRIMMDGHHRTATLLSAVRNDKIPETWLESIPVTIYKYTGDMPEPLVRRLATLGATMTWDDLLPPPILK